MDKYYSKKELAQAQRRFNAMDQTRTELFNSSQQKHWKAADYYRNKKDSKSRVLYKYHTGIFSLQYRDKRLYSWEEKKSFFEYCQNWFRFNKDKK